jgi:DNA-directed RNA polymerase subunit RPC12/RpoP
MAADQRYQCPDCGEAFWTGHHPGPLLLCPCCGSTALLRFDLAEPVAAA